MIRPSLLAVAGAVITWQTQRAHAAVDALARAAHGYVSAHERAALNAATWTSDTVAGPAAVAREVLQ